MLRHERGELLIEELGGGLLHGGVWCLDSLHELLCLRGARARLHASVRDSASLRADGGSIDQISGATVTSRAVTDALQRALRFFDAERERLLEVRP